MRTKNRALYQQLIRKTNPLNVLEIPQINLLEVLGFPGLGAHTLLEAGRGNIFNLAGWDIEDLEALPGIGPGQVSMLVALFTLLHHYEAWLEQSPT